MMKRLSASVALTMGIAACAGVACAMDPQEAIAPRGAIACVSEASLWHYSDARDRRDEAARQNLLNGECRDFEGKPYAVLDERNGTVKVLIFRKSDDWETAETFYTFTEMLQLY
jgi:hypothetical protein